jgi:hypothetical protein|tara:strand:+ start:877 stop:1098 length:222 start_codon:yes stop_codon:yes gene_type:complete
MTITERNNLQYDLRHRMWLAQMEVETCKEEIARLNRFYKEQFEPDIFDQMFGVSVKVPSIYTDTPMAEEVYGG